MNRGFCNQVMQTVRQGSPVEFLLLEDIRAAQSWLKPAPNISARATVSSMRFAAEKAGFRFRSTSATIFHPWSERGQACFAWTWLCAAAAKTDRIIPA